MAKAEVLEQYNLALLDQHPRLYLPCNPLTAHLPNVRPLSVSVEDVFFGDSGKGSVVAKLIGQMMTDQGLLSLRFNGGANAGHETMFNGKRVITHQLPMAVIFENATALISRGMVLNPEDLGTEIVNVEQTLGNKLPGKLTIDDNTPLCLDTHRAYETALNQDQGIYSTGSGIAPAYADIPLRRMVTVRDLIAKDWEEKLREHYKTYQKACHGFDQPLAEIQVNKLSREDSTDPDKPKRERRPVGDENEFTDRLREARNKIKSYVTTDVQGMLVDIWSNPAIPVIHEGAQGDALDPWHGVYPDTTASRPMISSIADATYGAIVAREIALKAAVMKTTYMSSVGSRRLPTQRDEEHEFWIQQQFNERGRTTNNLRDVYPVALPIAEYLRRVAQYDFMIGTHFDAAQENHPIRFVSHYTDKVTGQEKPYQPYQYALDKLQAHFVELPGWDGEAAQNAKSFDGLPLGAKVTAAFLSRTIAPIVMATTGPDLDEFIDFIPGGIK
jgi:adenylosuccinate synthase